MTFDRKQAKEVARLAKLGKLPSSNFKDASTPARFVSLTEREAASAVFRLLFFICGYRTQADMARIYRLTRLTVNRNIQGVQLPSPKTWARLCRDSTWRVERNFDWSLFKGRTEHTLKVVDNTYAPLDWLPGELDDLPDRDDVVLSMGCRGLDIPRAKRMMGITTYGMTQAEKWRRVAETKLWQLAGYPIPMILSADWTERTAVEWDPGFRFVRRRGYRDLLLPENPLDLIRTPGNLRG